MNSLIIKDEFIRLGQAMKLAGFVSSGVEAKVVIHSGLVTVNGGKVVQRGKKIYAGDVIEYEGEKVIVSNGSD